MAYRASLPNFSKGELAPELIARTDVASYSAGVRRARNVFIRKYGGLSKRMGTRFVSEVLDATQPVRLFPFQFSIEQAYALEFGQGYMRPAANGGMLLEEALAITGIDRGTTTTVYSAFHGYAVGDIAYFRDVVGMTQINGRSGKVLSVPNASKVIVDIDSSTFTPFTGDGGGVTRTEPPAPTPTPPPVPEPTPTPTPPATGGGGGDGRCVAADSTMIRLANDKHDGPGDDLLARDLTVGMWVWTQHETSLEWGAYRVLAANIANEPTYANDDHPDATGDHRFWHGRWVYARENGKWTGRVEPVLKASIDSAHTYMSRRIDSERWVLSHNLKPINPDLP